MNVNRYRCIGLSWACAIWLIGCATTLAPSYDQALVKGLTKTSEQLLSFFAEASSGTDAETFDKRQNQYNKLIGKMESLMLQARSRPIPTNKLTEKVNAALEKRGVQTLDDGEIPSAVAMELIAATLTKMRDTDQKQGLTAFEVEAFKGQVLVWLDQAMTYEHFLER